VLVGKAIDCLRILTTGNDANKAALYGIPSSMSSLVSLLSNDQPMVSKAYWMPYARADVLAHPAADWQRGKHLVHFSVVSCVTSGRKLKPGRVPLLAWQWSVNTIYEADA
jgi:hypothetical protein